MYANLRVTVQDREDAEPEVFYAWDVKVNGTRAEIYLDKQDGEGSYYEPAGMKIVSTRSHKIEVSASF